MRAVAVRAFGAPPEIMELPVPEPAEGELLVRVSGASVNPFDWKISDGILKDHRPHVFPLVLGTDGSGTVEKVGAGVREFRAGDRVFGQFLHDPVGTGTYAELATVPERNAIVRPPPNLDLVEAAGVPMAGMTALESVDALGARSGDLVLIVGATGGVGSFATQLASSRGLLVIATARPGADAAMRALGASETIDHTAGDLVDRLRSAHPDGLAGLVDLASDAAGFARHVTLVRRGGAAATTRFVAVPGAPGASGVRQINIDLHPRRELLERLSEEIRAG
ncbi:MAG TPA: NADP-dependent oxidoreductase, partial [Thermoplasmata archaeon]|nr:NADP-dependent oxidoreductase [Thermoplasmata archaeon]